MRHFLLLALAALCLIAARQGAYGRPSSLTPAGATPVIPIPSDTAAITGAVWDVSQDGAGTVWAIVNPQPQQGQGYGGEPGDDLYRWNGSGWTAVATPDGIQGPPAELTRSPNGWVYCLWDKGAITAYDGGRMLVISTAPLNLLVDDWRLFYADATNVWFVTRRGDFYRYDALARNPGPPKPMFSAPVSGYFPGFQTDDKGAPQFWGRWSAVTDALGRTWFYVSDWSGEMPRYRGVLIWTGSKMEPHPTLDGVPDTPIQSMSVFDGGHFLVGNDDGVELLDTSAMKAGPVQKAVRAPLTAQTIGGVRYLFTQHTSDYNDRHLPTGASNYLYRLTGSTWTQVAVGIDALGYGQWAGNRPYAATPAGAWIGSYGKGVWFLPEDGSAPRRIDYHDGFSLDSSDALFEVAPDMGGLLAIRTGREDRAIPEVVTHLDRYAAATPLKTLPVYELTGIERSPDGEVWALAPPAPPGKAANGPMGDGNCLADWNGSQWKKHDLPAGDLAEVCSLFAADSAGRIWMYPGWTPKLLIYDPKADSWKTYSDPQAALEVCAVEIKTEPNAKPLTVFTGGAALDVVYPDGRICTLDQAHVTAGYWDGSSWKSWDATKIIGQQTYSTFLSCPPFFGLDGSLLVDVEGTTYQLDAAGKWARQAQYVPGPPFAPSIPRTDRVYPDGPRDIGPHDGIFMCPDSDGNFWYTRNGVLYRYRSALRREAQVIPAGVVSPFGGGAHVMDVVLDGFGGAFLRTDAPNSFEWVQITTSAGSPPALTVRNDGHILSLAVAQDPALDPSTIQYSLDDGAWSGPAPSGRIDIVCPPVGKHVFRVRLIDRFLNERDLAPVSVDVEYDVAAVIAADIRTLLTGGDPARNQAVDELSRLPEDAVRKALAAAAAQATTDDQRWWLDAATQVVGRQDGAGAGD